MINVFNKQQLLHKIMKKSNQIQAVSNIKPFINKYNWKGINYPSKIDNWKTFEKNNPTIALNILYIKEKGTSSALSYNISLSYKISQILIRIKKKKNFSNDSK